MVMRRRRHTRSTFSETGMRKK